MNREITADLVRAMDSVLKPRGFRKRGRVFERAVGDVIHLVQLQKSVSSTAAEVRATVNLAVWVPALAPVRGGRPDSPAVVAAHWRERLGFLMPDGRDVWWTISTSEEAAASGSAIASALERVGVPALDRLGSAAALRTLWQAGISPGLTEKERARMLDRLGRGATQQPREADEARAGHESRGLHR